MPAKATVDRGEISPSEGLRAVIYGVNALMLGVNKTSTKRKLAQARNLLVEAQNLLHAGIVAGKEPRIWR